MKTRVVHCKKEGYDVYIGRPSKWGNPFSHKHGTKAEFIVSTREDAIKTYRKWITEGNGKDLLNDLHELKGKTLGCWCKPSDCHGDILAELADKYSLCHSCEENEANSTHSCPYKQEIANDSDTLCNCCDYCTRQCVLDI